MLFETQVGSIPLYMISHIILPFQLALSYDLYQDRCIDDDDCSSSSSLLLLSTFFLIPLLYKKSRFHFDIHLYSNSSQMASNVVKTFSDILSYRLVWHFLFLWYFDVICDLLLCTVSWNVFVKKMAKILLFTAKNDEALHVTPLAFVREPWLTCIINFSEKLTV